MQNEEVPVYIFVDTQQVLVYPPVYPYVLQLPSSSSTLVSTNYQNTCGLSPNICGKRFVYNECREE